MFFEVQWIGLGCCYDEIHIHVVISTVVILFIYSAVVTSLRGNKASRHIFSCILFGVLHLHLVLLLFLMHVIYSLIFIA